MLNKQTFINIYNYICRIIMSRKSYHRVNYLNDKRILFVFNTILNGQVRNILLLTKNFNLDHLIQNNNSILLQRDRKMIRQFGYEIR